MVFFENRLLAPSTESSLVLKIGSFWTGARRDATLDRSSQNPDMKHHAVVAYSLAIAAGRQFELLSSNGTREANYRS